MTPSFRRTYLCLVAMILVVALLPAQAENVSYVGLVERMTDLERLARLPVEGERCAMWSSYDRGATYDADSGKHVKWEANGDGNGLIRMEGDSQVIAEMDGPGVIWRIWSAKPEQGHVRVIIDGETAIDMPFAHYFDAKHPPFNYSSLGYESGRGKNLYFPIPYNRSCKIMADKGWGKYYQITYTTLPKGTVLPPLSDATKADAVVALKALDRYSSGGLGQDPAGEREGQRISKHNVSAEPRSALTVARLTGPRAITVIRVKAAFADRADQMAALRHLVLRITWDGEDAPAVWCPLGDFFGTAPGINNYKSLPLGMTEDGFYAFWYMPFAKSAHVELINEGDASRDVAFEITHAPLLRPVAQYGRFHAKWHRDVMPVSEDRWPDWTVVRTVGRGRFCGMMLHIWNPRGGRCDKVKWCKGHWWWGEGDEKFFVDGEKFPSTFGTGTEDYFGYAWGNGSLFQHPYNNQTACEGNAGHISVNRWQIPDNVPFQTSFDGYMEKYWPNDWPTLYAAVACWYLSPGGEDRHGPTPVAERHGYYVRPPMVAGGFTVLKRSAGTVHAQDMKSFKAAKWTRDDQLWWNGAQPGDRLELELKVEKTGRYAVSAVMTKAIDYGIVLFRIDDKKLGDPVDLFNDGVIRTDPVPLGKLDLKAGEHTLVVEIVGANEKAKKAYMFGLDELRLEAQ